jgi:hypothetical protein
MPAELKHAKWRTARNLIIVNLGGGHRRYEHRLIAGRTLGRPLKRNEVVHHIDGNPSNNAHSNLIITTPSYHAYLHVRIDGPEKISRRASNAARAQWANTTPEERSRRRRPIAKAGTNMIIMAISPSATSALTRRGRITFEEQDFHGQSSSPGVEAEIFPA